MWGSKAWPAGGGQRGDVGLHLIGRPDPVDLHSELSIAVTLEQERARAQNGRRSVVSHKMSSNWNQGVFFEQQTVIFGSKERDNEENKNIEQLK